MDVAVFNRPWPDERIDRLRTLYERGMSFGRIAAEIGISRNAAIGKAYRLNLAKRAKAIDRLTKMRGPGRKTVRAIAPHRKLTKVIEGQDYRCTIVDLTNASCRYPLWGNNGVHDPRERFYCGVPGASLADDVSYCPRHKTMCAVAPRSK